MNPKASWGTRLRGLTVFVMSRQGRHDIGAFLGAATAVYTALHRAGVL